MTASRHLIALLKSHFSGDEDHFLSIAMQVAAHEARQGHGKLAQELRDLVDEARSRGKQRGKKPVPLAQPKGELASLVSVSYSDTRLSSMVLPEDLEARLKRVLTEQRQQHRLRNHGLVPRRKLLLLGPPGSGKTMTAAALAGELHVPLFAVVFDSLISKFMGETASKLRIVFDAMNETRGVYFFDEFDAIGTRRGDRNDVGEIRRVLNSFLQLLEKDDNDSLIIAATNHPELLDPALFRRFDDVIRYGLPDFKIAIRILKTRLASFETEHIDWESVVKSAEGMSQSELARVADEAAKRAVLAERTVIVQDDLSAAIAERKAPVRH
jgi:SpoVK/Ycf46/Vps4 family AAA+-type ATPase